MSDISTTKMSSKSQVVIPEEIRENIPTLLKASRSIAKKYKFDEKDVADIVSEVRKSKESKNKINL